MTPASLQESKPRLRVLEMAGAGLPHEPSCPRTAHPPHMAWDVAASLAAPHTTCDWAYVIALSRHPADTSPGHIRHLDDWKGGHCICPDWGSQARGQDPGEAPHEPVEPVGDPGLAGGATGLPPFRPSSCMYVSHSISLSLLLVSAFLGLRPTFGRKTICLRTFRSQDPW